VTAKDRILDLIKDKSEISVKEITDVLLLSKQTAHTSLNFLVEAGIVEKLGRTPKTVYRLKKKNAQKYSDIDLKADDLTFLEKHFLLISETGDLKEGIQGFAIWCRQRNLPIEKTVNEFVSTRKKYFSYFDKEGFIDGMEKIKNTKGYSAIHLDHLLYLDFYAIERFGKTKLGTLLHYAKQGQSKLLMKRLVEEAGNKVSELCLKLKIDAINFVPPTIKREVQLMKFLQNNIPLPFPRIEIKKISGIIPVPQKSLSKIDERIRNAQNTFSVAEKRKFNHVLLIDDAVGSGATVNEIAGKLKLKGTALKVSALAITGSFKGFDVISDV
jgi:DNA-binding transcriptional ArsR family regulator